MKRYFFLKYAPAVVLFILLLIVCSFSLPFIREGMTSASSIGQYDFLAPPTDANKVTDDTYNKFVEIYIEIQPNQICANEPDDNKQTCIDNATNSLTNIFSNPETKNTVLSSNTNDELLFFNTNKYFPICNYVKEWFINHPSITLDFDINKSQFTCREIYKQYIYNTESIQNPQPLSYQIYMGTAVPPSVTSSSSSIPTLTTPTSTPTSIPTSIPTLTTPTTTPTTTTPKTGISSFFST